MYAERDSTERYSLCDMTRDEIEAIQVLVSLMVERIDRVELARLARRVAIAIDRALPNPEPSIHPSAK